MTTTNPRPQTWPEVAAEMFATGKRLSPARFPALPRKDDPEALAEFDALCRVWGEELEHINLTPRIWEDVVRWWCRNSGPDARWDIAEARRAGYRVRELWEADPEKREMLYQWRQWYLSQRPERPKLEGGFTPVSVTEAVVRPEVTGGKRRAERVKWRQRQERIMREIECRSESSGTAA